MKKKEILEIFKRGKYMSLSPKERRPTVKKNHGNIHYQIFQTITLWIVMISYIILMSQLMILRI